MVLRMMIREGLRVAALGIVIGLLLAAAVTRLISGCLFNINPLDAPTFIGMSIFVVVALIASYLPTHRAVASDPLTALHAE